MRLWPLPGLPALPALPACRGCCWAVGRSSGGWAALQRGMPGTTQPASSSAEQVAPAARPNAHRLPAPPLPTPRPCSARRVERAARGGGALPAGGRRLAQRRAVRRHGQPHRPGLPRVEPGGDLGPDHQRRAQRRPARRRAARVQPAGAGGGCVHAWGAAVPCPGQCGWWGRGASAGAAAGPAALAVAGRRELGGGLRRLVGASALLHAPRLASSTTGCESSAAVRTPTHTHAAFPLARRAAQTRPPRAPPTTSRPRSGLPRRAA